MKIRSGFVSNSSASSFIVTNKKSIIMSDGDDKELLTSKQKRLLFDKGFEYVNVHDPRDLLTFYFANLYDTAKMKPRLKKCERESLHKLGVRDSTIRLVDKQEVDARFGLVVICNQDEIIHFLLSNRIPFRASVHYGNQAVIYEKGKHYFYYFYDLGAYALMYGTKYMEESRKWRSQMEKINIQDYLKERI